MKGSDFVGGMLVGMLVGAAIGLLMAPQSGEETRQMMGKQAEDLTSKVRESSRQLLESGRDMYEQGKSQVSGTVNKAKEMAASSLRKGGEQAAEQVEQA